MGTLMGKIAYTDIETQEETFGERNSKFDWFQVTVSLDGWSSWCESTGEVVSRESNLVKWLASEIAFCDVVEGRGQNSYSHKVDLKRGDSIVCTVQWGGVNPDPNIVATGRHSGEIRDLVRSKFRQGRVSRVDSAFDSLSGESEFRRVTAWLEERAKRAGVNCMWIQNSDKSKGDTLYVGGRSSRVQVRVYEKGKQMGYKAGEWWRAEVQLRPDSKSKGMAYSYSPGMVWSASRVTRDLWAFLGGEQLAAVGFQVKEEKTMEEKSANFVKQYGNFLKDLIIANNGSVIEAMAYLDRLSESMGRGRIIPPESGERG